MIASFSYYMLNIFVPPSAASKYSMLLIYPFTAFSFFFFLGGTKSFKFILFCLFFNSILTFIYIFLIPFTAVLYHCLLTTPAFQTHFPMETVQPYLSFFFNLLMVLCLLSFISIIITTCNNTKKTD